MVSDSLTVLACGTGTRWAASLSTVNNAEQRIHEVAMKAEDAPCAL